MTNYEWKNILSKGPSHHWATFDDYLFKKPNKLQYS